MSEATEPTAPGDPKWLLAAFGEMGQAEIPGQEANPRIVEYHDTCLLKATSDEVAWCSAFVNWCMMKVGVPGTASAAARSWCRWGKEVQPQRGAVAVFKRGTGWQGHVALVLSIRPGGFIRVIGGNQGDRVSIAVYKLSDMIACRWP